VKTVIILAAGVGSRLRPITDELPKSIVPVNGVPLLSRFLMQVKSSSVKTRVVVVAGYLSNQISDLVSGFQATTNSSIQVIVNKDYETTNNMESCRIALEAGDFGDCIIVNADCIYDDEIVLDMIASNYSCVATDSGKYNDENMKVLVKKGHVYEISKNLPEQEGVNTSIDLYHFVKSDVDRLLKIMQGFYHRSDLEKWNEVAINELVKSSSIKTKDFIGRRWMEIDNLEDLKVAEDLFL